MVFRGDKNKRIKEFKYYINIIVKYNNITTIQFLFVLDLVIVWVNTK